MRLLLPLISPSCVSKFSCYQPATGEAPSTRAQHATPLLRRFAADCARLAGSLYDKPYNPGMEKTLTAETLPKIVTADMLAETVYAAIPGLACDVPADVLAALQQAAREETDSRATEVLDLLVENARVASQDRVPICQDTGTVWVSLEIGPDITIAGDVFSGVNDAVARAYTEAALRKSVVRDALFDRANTGDNTPAFCDVHFADKPGARVHIMLKGGGSDNASRVVMLPPSAGEVGIIDEVVKCVREKAANACPPLIIGVGIGATFDKVGGLAKRALMRPIGIPAADEDAAALESKLLSAVNATGVGAGALGGCHTALAVRVIAAPCHIAAMPLAINMGCSATRRGTYEL